METADRTDALTAAEYRTFVEMTRNEATPFAHDADDERLRQDVWDAIEGQLIEWACDPSLLDDDGVTTPSRRTFKQAIELAKKLAAQGSSPPTRVVPDANGGIVFELSQGSEFQSLHVEPDGEVENLRFLNHRLIFRETWRQADETR